MRNNVSAMTASSEIDTVDNAYFDEIFASAARNTFMHANINLPIYALIFANTDAALPKLYRNDKYGRKVETNLKLRTICICTMGIGHGKAGQIRFVPYATVRMRRRARSRERINMAEQKGQSTARLADYERQLRAEEKSDVTVEKYLRDVRAFLMYCGGAAWEKSVIIAYKQKLLGDGYAVSSINSMLASVNSFFSFIGREDLRVKSIKTQRQIFCPEEKEISRTEYERLCAAARGRSERLYLLLQTICGTGIRVSEVAFITVEAARRGEATVSCKGKTRSVFLVRRLQKKLLDYAKQQRICSGPIFVTRSGNPLGRTAIWREMKSLCAEAGVSPQKVFPHNLRHLFARIFYAIEKDIAKLADILGHSSINTTRIYIISTGTEHRRRMEHMKLIL